MPQLDTPNPSWIAQNKQISVPKSARTPNNPLQTRSRHTKIQKKTTMQQRTQEHFTGSPLFCQKSRQHGHNLAPQIDPKSLKTRSKNWYFLEWFLASILDALWLGFWVQLGLQNRTKSDQNRPQDALHLGHRFWVRFGCDFGTNLEPTGPKNRWFFIMFSIYFWKSTFVSWHPFQTSFGCQHGSIFHLNIDPNLLEDGFQEPCKFWWNFE